jgi:hypothetical protein
MDILHDFTESTRLKRLKVGFERPGSSIFASQGPGIPPCEAYGHESGIEREPQ